MKARLEWIRSRLTDALDDWAIAWDIRRMERLTVRAAGLRAGEEYDLVDMARQKFVRVFATGRSITEVCAEIESRLLFDLRVVIRPGDCFIARGAHQNMAVRTEQRLHLYGLFTKHLLLPATCINAERPIPGEQDRFVKVRRSTGDLARFLDTAQFSDPMVVQAGAWAITDGYSQPQVQERLWTTGYDGRRQPAISGSEIAEARRMLNELGIRHRL